jgi:multidrug efflux pump
VVSAIRRDPDVSGVISIVGVSTLNLTPNSGRLSISLKPRDSRKAFVTEIVRRLAAAVAPIPGVTVYFLPVQDIQISTRFSRSQYQYTLVSTDAQEVAEWSDKLVARLNNSTILPDIASEAQEGGLRAKINIDRVAAGRLGVSMQAVNDTLNDAFGQRQISTIFGQANQYRVILEAMPQYQNDPTSLSKLYVSSTNNVQIPLSRIATLERTTAPLAIMHQEQFPAVTLSFNLSPDASLGDAVKEISAAEGDIGMPSSVIGSYAGDAAEFSRSLRGEPWLLLAAAVTIYIVLGVLY